MKLTECDVIDISNVYRHILFKPEDLQLPRFSNITREKGVGVCLAAKFAKCSDIQQEV